MSGTLRLGGSSVDGYVCALRRPVAVRRANQRPAAGTASSRPGRRLTSAHPQSQGSTTGDGSSFTVVGAGTNIWSWSDQFQFAYQALTGDGTITARVTGVQQADAWTKAGVMIRASLSPDAANAFTFTTSYSGNGFQRRSVTGGWSDWVPGCSCYPPTWLRLVRAGSTVTAYESSDGLDWRVLGPETIAMPASVYVGLAVTSHNADLTALATFSDVTVSSSSAALPPASASAWPSTDIGAPPIAGSDTAVDGLFTVSGGGGDIWDSVDRFHYVFQQVTGDTQIVARVASLQGTSIWSKAGVMIRGDLTEGAQNAAMFALGGGGWDFQRRVNAGGRSDWTSSAGGTTPGWVKLVRSGNLLTAFRSADGLNWSTVGSSVIAMPNTVYVGLAVASADPFGIATATFTDVTIGTPSASNQPPSNQPPSVQLFAPTSAFAPATISLSATAGDADGAVTRVDFYANGQLVAFDTSSPFTATWTGVPAGFYSLTAVATDDDGATAVSNGVSLTVGATAAQPTTTVIFVPPIDYATNVSGLRVELRRASDATYAGASGRERSWKAAGRGWRDLRRHQHARGSAAGGFATTHSWSAPDPADRRRARRHPPSRSKTLTGGSTWQMAGRWQTADGT